MSGSSHVALGKVNMALINALETLDEIYVATGKANSALDKD